VDRRRCSRVFDIISLIQQSPTDIHIQWVPGHCVNNSNELADQYAKQVAAIKDDPPVCQSVCPSVATVDGVA